MAVDGGCGSQCMRVVDRAILCAHWLLSSFGPIERPSNSPFLVHRQQQLLASWGNDGFVTNAGVWSDANVNKAVTTHEAIKGRHY